MTRVPAQLVRGQVMHARLRPVANRFVYPVFYVRLNLARLDDCNWRWFGVNRRRPLSIRTRDYGPRDGSNLELWMRALLREHGIEADGEIWLQTFPRIAGFVFNPVSFWHCHDSQGTLRAVLAEVNNTFGETHRYLLRVAPSGGQAVLRAECVKAMHVSPFCEVRGAYQFRFRITDGSHFTAIDYYDENGLLIKTSVSGRPAAMTDAALLSALLRYPLQCVGVVARIHWQALRLWLKGVPFFRKPPSPIHPITAPEEIQR
jgi:DUF1365 family protein